MDILVVYFSRTGHTQRIAAEIAAATGADLDPIVEQRSRKGILGYLRSGRDAYKKLIVPIEPSTKNPADYEIVVLGTPVWAGHISSPVRAYVAAHREQLARVALFCTEGGSGGTKVLRELAELIDATPVGTLVIDEKELRSGAYAGKLERFLEALPRSMAAGSTGSKY